MSRLSDLLRQLRIKDEALADDLEREVAELADRQAFGLNFERHVPETVELPGRRVRRGDKVRILPPRGTTPKAVDEKLWRVVALDREGDETTASLEALDGAATASSPVADLVVIAEFRDPVYPGLVSTGKVERGGGRPFHTIINAENYYAVQALLFTHRGKVDCIYIDPPYNTGAKDWKYNNDYVEGDDLYRHSKWLAFMERRLRLAKDLLRPESSVLIVTIDNKEMPRLALLLEQTFPEARIEMITTVINPRGKYRPNEFARSDEYIFFVAFGSAMVQGEPDEQFADGSEVPWRTLRRSDLKSARGTPKGGTAQFYPIHVTSDGKIHEIGEAIPSDVDRNSVQQVDGCTAVFPVRDDGTEMNWGLTAPSLRRLHAQGYVRVGRATPAKPQKYELSYLLEGRILDIAAERATVVGRNHDGSVIARYVTSKLKMPTSTWIRPSHNAETQGTELLKTLIGHKGFDYPKSLYAVEDSLRLFLGQTPAAVVVDFFAGSGTTAHAVMRLNRQDGGRRQCILVTNNEVSVDEQAALRAEGLRPGDEQWERLGICEYIAKPRIIAAVTGRTPSGEPLKGDYRFIDEFPMADGFEENVEFFNLSYEAPLRVASNREFAKIAPLLWMRAGAQGRCIGDISMGWDVAEAYGVVADLDKTDQFTAALKRAHSTRTAFIVTDEDRLFEAVVRNLPEDVEPVRLYEAYLRNFEIETGRSAL